MRFPCATRLIITGNSKELLEQEVRPQVEQFLQDRGLRLSPEKTRITHISQGFDLLGQHLHVFGTKLIIQPSKKNTQGFLEKIRRTIKVHVCADQATLIGILNPMIRGWANYHRHVSATATFWKVDHEIWRALWRWATRRHPKKGKRWVRKRYFHTIGSSCWAFAVDTGERLDSGKTIWQKLVKASQTRIQRHVKIRGDANPFDPNWYDYFEERSFLKTFGISRRQAGITLS